MSPRTCEALDDVGALGRNCLVARRQAIPTRPAGVKRAGRSSRRRFREFDRGLDSHGGTHARACAAPRACQHPRVRALTVYADARSVVARSGQPYLSFTFDASLAGGPMCSRTLTSNAGECVAVAMAWLAYRR